MDIRGTQRINDAGHLEIGGCDTADLAREFGTPLYVLDEAQILDHERVKLVRKFGTLDDKTGNVSVAPDRFLEFGVEWQKALDSEISIGKDAVNLTDKDIEGLRIAPRVIMLLDPAVTFGE